MTSPLGDVVAEGFDHAGRAVLAEDLGHLRGQLAIGVALALGHRDDEAVGVAAAAAAPSSTIASKPPMIMRLPSNGMFAPISFMRGSLMHLLVGRVARRPVRIFEPGEDDLLVVLGIDRLAEVGDLAFGNVAVPGLDHAADADSWKSGANSLACL